ncbi:MAG: ATP-binding protein [Thermoanaerobaculales bacterium]
MTYLPRDIDLVLKRWSETDDRKPLVLRGARQTGKSASVRHFGKSFDLFLEVNLERFEDLSMVRSCRSHEDLLSALRTRHNIVEWPRRTLLFLDEIQESPEAIQWLRFFREDRPDLFVVAAGSLMEVRLADKGFSFPVGRVTFRVQRPFSFFEFLRAIGHEVLLDVIVDGALAGSGPPPPVHRQALELLRDYLLVGGMPEAVVHWRSEQSHDAVRRVHSDLVTALAEDIQKYGRGRETSYLEAAFENLPHHYGTRFRYESFAPGFRSQLMKTAVSKLEGALVVSRVWPTSSLDLPLRRRPKSAPKLLPLDVGIATHTSAVSSNQLRRLPLERLLDGRLAEVFVGQELLASRTDADSLFFWVRESSKGAAEVDYLLEAGDVALPLEVKAGASGSLKSLHQFLWRSGGMVGLRLYTGAYADERHTVRMPGGELDYRLLSLPLYLAGLVGHDPTTFSEGGASP